MTNQDSILKSRDITLLTKICIVKAMVFPVVMYGCESWTIKKAECWRIDAFELWCWRRLSRVSWTARRSNQSILKEISPEYLLEGKKGNTKECSNYHTIVLISHASKVMFKILQVRLQQYMNQEPDVQAGFLKSKGIRDQIAVSVGSSKKQENSRKISTSALLTTPKPLTVWIATNCGKFWKRWEYQTTLPSSWEICMQVKKQHWDLDMELKTGSKLEME